MLPSKQGEIYVLDRRTGAPLTPVVERIVPQGGVEPAQRAATQPFSGFATLRKPNLTERDLIAFCHTQLTHYKVPKFVEFRTELPKTNVGKILRRQLRDEPAKVETRAA